MAIIAKVHEGMGDGHFVTNITLHRILKIVFIGGPPCRAQPPPLVPRVDRIVLT